MVEATNKVLKNPNHGQNAFLTQVEAAQRSDNISGVAYRVAFNLPKGGDSFVGKATIDFSLNKVTENTPDQGQLFLDYTGRQVSSFHVNGQQVTDTSVFINDRLYLPSELQKVGSNVAEVVFESEYVRNCEGVHWFKDEADDTEYIFSDFQPANAHKWIPCFDQPDLKAKQRIVIYAVKEWEVRSNCALKSNGMSEQLAREFLLDAETQKLLADGMKGDHVIHEFAESVPLSTYLFSFVAGSFAVFYPESEDPKCTVPLGLLCRKSLEEHGKAISKDWFRVTRAGIKYYEDMFQQPYPFDKLDQILCPDYQHGAMENVGCITYRDGYLSRGEKLTRYRQEYVYNVILHEVSHMWFGNLVTPKWWDGLWLNEAFADMISFMCMDVAEGLEDCYLAWNLFMDETLWGLKEDQMDSTHPVAATCKSVADAQDIFDGLSYGKGASFLHQLVFFFGEEVLKEGCNTWFKEFKYGNSNQKQFLSHMGAAAKKLGITKVDIPTWADEWLNSAGCSEIIGEIQETDGKIGTFTVLQSLYGNSNLNRLRAQKIQIALLDENLQVLKIVAAETDSLKGTTEVPELVGEPVPAAYLLDYGAFGYGKFTLAPSCLPLICEKLSMLKERDARKQVYNVIADMVRGKQFPGSQFLSVIKNNLPNEEAEENVMDVLENIVPSMIKKYIPLSSYDQENSDMYVMVMKILVFKKFIGSESTSQLLVRCAIDFASTQLQVDAVISWLDQPSICDVAFTTPDRHQMVRTIYGCKDQTEEQKSAAFEKLRAIDSSDKLGLTEKFCQGVVPTIESKRKVWDQLMHADIDKMSLYGIQELMSGFQSIGQRALLVEFKQKYFDQIGHVLNTKSSAVARRYFDTLCPNMEASAEEIAMFEKYLTEREAIPEKEQGDGETRLKKWLGQAIQDSKEMNAAKQISSEWLSKQ